MLIGLYGGAFDPFHKEHKKVIESAYAELNLDKIMIIPSFNPPHKDNPLTKYEDRVKIIEQEIKSLPYVTINNIEKENANRLNYSYLTISELKKTYPLDDFIYIIGGDSMINFDKWFKPEEICSLTQLAVVERKGYKKLDEAIIKAQTDFNARIIKLCVQGEDISSKELRAKLELSLNIGDYLGEGAKKVIRESNLYSNFSKIVDFAKKKLSKARYEHSVRTLLYAVELLKNNDVSFEKVFISALLHDIAKDNDITGYKVKETAHQYEGAKIVKEMLKIEDESIINAIKYHATAHPEIDKLGKIVFVADKLEWGKDYKGVEELRRLATEDLDKAFIAILEHNINYLINAGKDIDENTINCYKKLRSE